MLATFAAAFWAAFITNAVVLESGSAEHAVTYWTDTVKVCYDDEARRYTGVVTQYKACPDGSRAI